jgi:hypothetical protein
MLRSRLVSLGISIVILIVIFIWQHDRFLDNPLPMILVYAVVLLGGIGWVVGMLIAYRAARRAVAGDRHGVALRVDRRGLELAGQPIPWASLGSLETTKGSWPQGPGLRAATTDGRSVEVPLEQLPVLPATLDSTVRAYSGGRFGLDLSALDA